MNENTAQAIVNMMKNYKALSNVPLIIARNSNRYVDWVLDNMKPELASACEKLYVEQTYSVEHVARDMNLSERGLRKRIHKDILRVISIR